MKTAVNTPEFGLPGGKPAGQLLLALPFVEPEEVVPGSQVSNRAPRVSVTGLFPWLHREHSLGPGLWQCFPGRRAGSRRAQDVLLLPVLLARGRICSGDPFRTHGEAGAG